MKSCNCEDRPCCGCGQEYLNNMHDIYDDEGCDDPIIPEIDDEFIDRLMTDDDFYDRVVGWF